MYFYGPELKLYYEVIGEGIPIIMIHGCPCDHKLMQGCMEPIFKNSEKYKRVYFDLPGMGRTRASLEYANADKILECICDFINYITAHEFIIVGESYGGYLANGVIKKYSNRVIGAAFICPVVVPNSEERILPISGLKKYDLTFIESLEVNEKVAFCKYAIIANEYTYKRYKNEIASGISKADMNFIKSLEQRYAFGNLNNEAINAFGKPILIILGQQDECVGYSDAKDMFSKCPRATMAILDCAGHNLQIEHPQMFNAIVEDWLLNI